MKTLFLDLITNYWLYSAVGGWFLSQVFKLFTGVFKARKFTWRAFIFGSGGMPSAHTAAVSGLLTATVVTEGGASPIPIIVGLLAVVMMTDAAGVRRETGRQSAFLNRLIRRHPEDAEGQEPLQEFMGHTPFQIAVGFVIGVGSALLLSLLPFPALG